MKKLALTIVLQKNSTFLKGAGSNSFRILMTWLLALPTSLHIKIGTDILKILFGQLVTINSHHKQEKLKKKYGRLSRYVPLSNVGKFSGSQD